MVNERRETCLYFVIVLLARGELQTRCLVPFVRTEVIYHLHAHHFALLYPDVAVIAWSSLLRRSFIPATRVASSQSRFNGVE